MTATTQLRAPAIEFRLICHVLAYLFTADGCQDAFVVIETGRYKFKHLSLTPNGICGFVLLMFRNLFLREMTENRKYRIIMIMSKFTVKNSGEQSNKMFNVVNANTVPGAQIVFVNVNVTCRVLYASYK